MNAALLNVAGFVGTLSAIAKGPGASAQSETRKLLQAMADAPLTGPRFPSKPEQTCPVCNGRGTVIGGPDIGLGYDEITCRDCDGTGVVEPDEDTESDRELFARYRAELAQDEPSGWSDASEQYEEMPE